METIELEKGWLERQMDEVRRDVEKWPEVLKPLKTINSDLTTRTKPVDSCSIQGPNPPTKLPPRE